MGVRDKLKIKNLIKNKKMKKLRKNTKINKINKK